VRVVSAKNRNGERNWVIKTLPRTVQNSAIDLPGRTDYEYYRLVPSGNDTRDDVACILIYIIQTVPPKPLMK
jgi:hypothetical protein